LTTIVPNGNEEAILFCTNFEIRYLAIPPMKLPEPMKNRVLSIHEDKEKL
jgi:hypothetical protein